MPIRSVYDQPRVLETFDALDVMGAAEGLEVYVVGDGSKSVPISIAA